MEPKFQLLTSDQLSKLLQESSICERIRSGALKAVEQSRVPARIPGGGASSIVSFYDGDVYICTRHRILTSDGKILHQDFEDAVIDGVWYKKASRFRK